MGLLSNILFAIIHLTIVITDMAIVLLGLRVLNRWRTGRLLRALDAVGQPFVDELSATINRLWSRLWSAHRLSVHNQVNLALIVVMLARTLLGLIAVSVS